MKVWELVSILANQNPDAEVYIFGESNGVEVRTEVANSVVSGDWGPQPYIIISADDMP